MGRGELERLSREELIELMLRLQRPEKTARTSSKPPATDRKERREQAKPGHEGHSRLRSNGPDEIIAQRPAVRPTPGPPSRLLDRFGLLGGKARSLDLLGLL